MATYPTNNIAVSFAVAVNTDTTVTIDTTDTTT